MEHSSERTEKLLTAILINATKASPLAEKIQILSLAGFSAVEIADLLDTTAGNVRNVLYGIRKEKKRRKA